MPVAYLYSRFSSDGQKDGDSLRRQKELAEGWCTRKSIKLAGEYCDRGISAYTSQNLESGKLGALIEDAKSGVIEKGSYLLIEDFDRLSRATPRDATKSLLQITELGLIVVILTTGQEYGKETDDIASMLTQVTMQHLAHTESANKARRVREAFSARRGVAAKTPIAIFASCPYWMYKERGHYHLIPEYVIHVKKLFELSAKGMGSTQLSKLANSEKWLCNVENWSAGKINKILNNRAAIGEWQPYITLNKSADGATKEAADLIENYYPKIVEKELFYKSLHAVSHRASGKRRDAEYTNVGAYLLRCSCGSSIVRKGGGSLRNSENYSMYDCRDRQKGITKCPSLNYKYIELTLIPLMLIAGVQPYSRAESDALSIEIQQKRREVDREQKVLDQYSVQIDRLAMQGLSLHVLVDKMVEAEKFLKKGRDDIRVLEARKYSLRNSVSLVQGKGYYEIKKRVDDYFTKIYDSAEKPYRSELNLMFRDAVNSIVVNGGNKTATVFMKNGLELEFALGEGRHRQPVIVYPIIDMKYRLSVRLKYLACRRANKTRKNFDQPYLDFSYVNLEVNPLRQAQLVDKRKSPSATNVELCSGLILEKAEGLTPLESELKTQMDKYSEALGALYAIQPEPNITFTTPPDFDSQKPW